ncbi:hypothetical protein [Bdellovibrio sp. HCB-162]|uniref:hypothetical protein n=1 Tax=Bdellovibrio sp. HCB-162 TaxID=3394234 RepID=UPI0039BD6C58
MSYKKSTLTMFLLALMFSHSAFAAETIVVSRKTGVFSQNEIQTSFTVEWRPPACDPDTSYDCGADTVDQVPGHQCRFRVIFPLVAPNALNYSDYGLNPLANLPRDPGVYDATPDICAGALNKWKQSLPNDGLIHYEITTVDVQSYFWKYPNGVMDSSSAVCMRADDYYEILNLHGIGEENAQPTTSVLTAVDNSLCANIVK